MMSAVNTLTPRLSAISWASLSTLTSKARITAHLGGEGDRREVEGGKDGGRREGRRGEREGGREGREGRREGGGMRRREGRRGEEREGVTQDKEGTVSLTGCHAPTSLRPS